MKKLMIAALAAVSVAGVYGACDYSPSTAWVYKWTFSGKTTFGVKPAAVEVSTGMCGYTGGGSSDSTCTVRAPASLKIQGYTWYCEPGCGSDDFEKFTEVNELFWQTKPFKATLAGGVATDVSNIIGKKAKQFEAAGTATFTEFINGNATEEGTYTLTYAGLGKYDLKNERVSSVSGNFAGFLDQPHYISTKDCVNAGYWECETLNLTCTGTSVAYGKWSAKYQSGASKKFYKKNIRSAIKYPSWVYAKINGSTEL